MLAVDVNVLVPALRDDAPDSAAMRTWVEEAVATREPLGVSDAVLIGTARILTHPRIFTPPMPPEEAWERLTDLATAAGVVRLHPGPGHLAIVAQLCRSAQAKGNLVADAQHAAVAIEYGATLVTRDRDFARFPGLRWRHPLDA